MKRLTHDEYVERTNAIHNNIEVLEEYKGRKTKILHKCNVHNYEWYTSPNTILAGKGCPKCSGSYRRTHEDYVNELKDKNPNLEVIGTFIDVDTKILHRCKIHDYVFEKFPSLALKGSGCIKCATDMKKEHFTKTHEQYASELQEIHPDIEVVGEYINSKTKILHRCKVDGYEWLSIPDNVLRNSIGCPVCSGNNHRTHEEYVQKLKEINPNVEVVGQYINSQTKILHRCIIHNYEWYAYPNNFIKGNGCPLCASSNGEKIIEKWLKFNHVKYEPQKKFYKCKDKRNLPFDFYLPEHNICIEYDGEQHYEPIEFFGGDEAFIIRQRHDKLKTDYCENNGIKLVRIAYNENIEEKLNLLFA
jgi:very-short-patch-repair endonuclease/ribosomal protein S18